MCRALLPQHRETGSRNALAVLESLVSLIGMWGHALECNASLPHVPPLGRRVDRPSTLPALASHA
jgi:hypothetical protein